MFGVRRSVNCAYVTVTLFLVLSPVHARESPVEDGYTSDFRMLERSDAQTTENDFLHSNRLLLFGTIQLDTTGWSHKDCELELSVDISEYTWKQQLRSTSFAFQVPVTSFSGAIGMLAIHEHGRYFRNLWKQFFFVQDVGVLHYNVTLSGHCTRVKFSGRTVIPWTPSACPRTNVMEESTCPMLCLKLPTKTMLIHSPVVLTNEENVSIGGGSLEGYPSAKHDRRGKIGMMFIDTLSLYIWNVLIYSGDSSRWHLVFGLRFLRTWHFYCLAIVFLFLQIVHWILRLLESLTTALSSLERPVAVDKCAEKFLSWELCTSGNSSGPSFTGHSMRYKQNLLLSGDAPYQDSWSAAHDYLQNLMEFPADGSGFYYNCTAQSRSFSNVLLHNGRWSRDSNGRLIRDRP